MKNEKLDIEKVLVEFRKYEESSGHRKGTFKLDVPFEQAVKKIAKAKSERHKSKRRMPLRDKRRRHYSD